MQNYDRKRQADVIPKCQDIRRQAVPLLLSMHLARHSLHQCSELLPI